MLEQLATAVLKSQPKLQQAKLIMPFARQLANTPSSYQEGHYWSKLNKAARLVYTRMPVSLMRAAWSWMMHGRSVGTKLTGSEESPAPDCRRDAMH